MEFLQASRIVARKCLFGGLFFPSCLGEKHKAFHKGLQTRTLPALPALPAHISSAPEVRSAARRNPMRRPNTTFLHEAIPSDNALLETLLGIFSGAKLQHQWVLSANTRVPLARRTSCHCHCHCQCVCLARRTHTAVVANPIRLSMSRDSATNI